MTHSKNLLAAAILGSALFAGAAYAGGYNDSSSYNGLGGQYNNTSNASLRDANGNLTLVDGQFTSASYSQNTGMQTASAGGVGMGGAGTTTATATAIGNSLNVQVIGMNNTTVINSTQINNGNQTASANLTKNGH